MRYGGNKNKGLRAKKVKLWERFSVWNPNCPREFPHRGGTMWTCDYSCRSWHKAVLKALSLGPGSEVTFRTYRGKPGVFRRSKLIKSGMITFEDILTYYARTQRVIEVKRKLGIV